MIHYEVNSVSFQRFVFRLIYLLVISAQVAVAQIKQVVVGITPTCPYGFAACWAGAKEGLSALEGVDVNLVNPNYEDCTADMQLTPGQQPNLFKWAGQFRHVVGQIYAYRGIEIIIDGYLIERKGSLIVQSPYLKKPITVVPFRHKLQWDFKKAVPKPITQTEQHAYQQALATIRQAKQHRMHMQLTGPLTEKPNQLVLELRAFSTHPN